MKVVINDGEAVTATVYRAPKSKRCGATLVLGHGAGANQHSDFMVRFAVGLAARGLTVVTFNFLYTEQGRKAPDRAAKLEACYRAVIAATRKKFAADKLFIGGKSMGGRIASQVAAAGVEDLCGLVFLGYPLHPPGKPDELRAAHLAAIHKPMFFAQGERDPFGTPEELQPLLKKLKPAAHLYVIAAGDHSFAVAKKLAVSTAQIYNAAQDEITRWLHTIME
ncbi:MAG: alpha/beta fold hydrolase [Acidobacteria bacterium]|nr:alpha/beta fold hydrolase [Acidobacteriota bacterium]